MAKRLLALLSAALMATILSPATNQTAAQLRTDVVGFQDSFDGAALGDTWEVANGDPDSYIVESGTLTIITKAVGGLTNADIPNLFRLEDAIPEGDWTATVIFSGEMQTGRDMLEIGLYTDIENMIVARFYSDATRCCGNHGFYVDVVKLAQGERATFAKHITQATSSADIGQPVTVQLVKSGRSYQARANLAGDVDEEGKPRWYETGVVSSLRPPGTFVLNTSQWEETSGESLYMIESVTIEPGAP